MPGGRGLEVTRLGLGCAPLGNLYRACSDRQARELVEQALAHGIRFFDTAPHYGQGLSERRLGDALRGRTDCIVSTKAGRLLRPAGQSASRDGFVSPMPFEAYFDYSHDGVFRSYEASLHRLGLDHIDVLLMHDLGRETHGDQHLSVFSTAMQEGYRAMQALRDRKLVKAIGIGVNEIEVCENALEAADWDCILLAGRYSLLDQQALHSLFPKCLESGTAVILGGPYNSGILATGVAATGIARYNYEPAPEQIVARVAAMEEICRGYQVPLPAAALQFAMAHPVVKSVIPGIDTPDRVAETLAWLRMDIPGGLWESLKEAGIIHPEAPVPGPPEDHDGC